MQYTRTHICTMPGVCTIHTHTHTRLGTHLAHPGVCVPHLHHHRVRRAAELVGEGKAEHGQGWGSDRQGWGMALREAHLAGATSGATSQKRQVRDRQQQGCHTASLSPESNSEPCLPIPPSTTPKCQTFRLCFPRQRHGIGVGDFSGKGKVCFDSEWIIEK